MSDYEDLEISCPFCDEVVVYESGREGNEGSFDSSLCRHVVFAYSWGTAPWDDNDAVVQTGDPHLDARVRGCIQLCGSPDDLGETVMRKVRRLRTPADGWKITMVTQYVERGLGPKGGGPTYVMVFVDKV